MEATKTQINPDNNLVFTNEFGRVVNYYDDGYGPLWLISESMGYIGIVRAATWEEAYSVCEDEIFSEATETLEEIQREYNFKREHVKDEAGRWQTIETPCPDSWQDNALFQEAFGFRPNGPNSTDKINHGIYAKDLNGERLEPLTYELLEKLQIKMTFSSK